VSRALQQALAGMEPLAGFAPGPAADTVAEHPGQGLSWSWQGRTWQLGRADSALATTAVLSADGTELARFTFTERYRADAPAELAALARHGLTLHLLSGDARPRVEAAAQALGIPAANVRAELSPEAKAAVVRALDRQDTLMVGDGLNDGPAFAAAFCAATPAVDRPVLPGRADFYFLGDGIAALRRALAVAQRLRRVVRDNLILAVLYNVIAVSLSLAGLVTPVVAAVLMPASSLAIVGITLYRLSPGRSTWTS
jgi:P-type Cu2+ transporter